MATVATMPSEVWASYLAWNDAIAEVVFPELEVPEPVYLDLEDDVLSEIGARVGVAGGHAEALSRAVAATLGTGYRAFAPHSRRLADWARGDRLDPPPILPVLSVLSLAAEAMAAGEGFVSHDFYGRLRALLELDPDDQNIVTSYRRVAERFWGALNSWLNEWGGQRGLPTAFALGHRYVGLPMSQALVRKADRERLIQFFLRFGFSPGSDVTPGELETVLDLWMRETPCPATRNLARLWEKREAHSRIAQAASVSLSAWDGRVNESGDGSTAEGRIALGLEISGFPRKRFSIDVLVYADRPELERPAEVQTADGTKTFGLSPVGPGSLLLGGLGDFDNAGLLEGVLRVRDTLSGRTFTRRPKRLLVFRQDPLSMRWLEISQVLLGEDVRLIVRSDLLDRLVGVLEQIARPGWRVVESGYAGLPEDWAVVLDVEVLTHLAELERTMDDLGALVPLTHSQLKLAGGLALPRASRGEWHSWAPPEVRAVSDTPKGFRLCLLDVSERGDVDDGTFETLAEWTDDGQGLLLVDLAEQGLPDGDYRLELVPHGQKDPLTTQHFRLRSGDSPDLIQWHRVPDTAYHLADPLGVIGASSQADGCSVSGAVVIAREGLAGLQSASLPPAPWWSTDNRQQEVSGGVSRSSVQLERVPNSSCLYTGRHHEEIDLVPLDKRLRPMTKFSLGRCKNCGLVRRYSTDYYKNRRAHQRRKAQVQVDEAHRSLHNVKDVPDSTTAVSWDLVLDGVMHTGGGPWASLERLAMHIDATGLFVDQFARSLEALGHIDIRRDPDTLRPTHWEVTPSALASTSNGDFLVGFWPNELTAEVAELLSEYAIDQECLKNTEGPASWFLQGQDVYPTLKEAGYDVSSSGDSWHHIAVLLPTLSRLIDSLPRRSADVDGKIKVFDVPTARWVDARDVRAAGAYRVSRFSTLDVIRTEGDVRRGQIAVSTVQLSKHAAALIAGCPPLLAYRPDEKELLVPLGADLPCLYGRAAVLCSGLLPEVRGRLLVYRNVPASLAQHLSHLLSH